VSTFTEISGCFQPRQAKVVLGPTPLANTQCRKFKKNIPRKGIARCGLSPNFHIHLSVGDLYIPAVNLAILLLENMWTDPGNI
jgi:hypothetical protein